MPRWITALALLLAMPALAAAAKPPAAPLLDLRAGSIRFTLQNGRGMTLSRRGVPVIRESTLYIVSPGWTTAYINQDRDTPSVTSAVENGVQVGTADYETADAYARYRFEVGPDDTFKVTLTYGTKNGQKAGVEYDAAYLNANLLDGAIYKAQTVEGDRDGEVPLFATSSDQTASKLTPNITHIAFGTPIGRMEIDAQGSDDTNKALTLFDARLGTASWTKRNPVFWLGIGVPEQPVAPGPHTVTITYTLGVPIPNPTIHSIEGKPVLIPLKEASVPYAPDWPIIPQPKEIKSPDDAPYRISSATRLIIPTSATEEEKQAARELQAEFRDFWNVRLRIVRLNLDHWDGGLEGRGIFLARIQAIPRAQEWMKAKDKELAQRSEGYGLFAERDGCGVFGNDPRGVYNGAQTLKQLIRVDAKGVYIKPVNISDWPSMAFRGVHWFGGPESVPFHKKMIDRIIAPFKMNAMVYEAEYTQWASQPKIWSAERSTPKADVKATVDYARAHFIEPIPLIQSLGHSEWLFQNKQNLDIASDPTHPFAYNPENPRSYEALFPVFQEAIDLFHPKTFHIGHDEVTTQGKFPPAGVNKSATDLILEDTNKLHDWLAAKGIKTMMWGDMLLYKNEASDAGLAPTPEDAAARRTGIPKDTAIADWHYQGSDADFPSVDVLQKAGYQVIGTSWFDWGNIQNFSRVLTAAHSRGLLQSTWAGFTMSADIVKSEEFKQFVAYLVAAEYAWNGGAPDLDKLGYSPDDAFLAAWNRAPVSMAKRPGFTVDLTEASNANLWQWSPATTTVMAKARTTAKMYPRYPTGRVTLGGTVFQTEHPVWLAGALNQAGAWPETVTVPLDGRKAAELHWLWGTSFPTVIGTPVARIKVSYADGASVEAPITYGDEIFAFTDQRAGVNVNTVWRGGSPFGEKASARRYVWKNPHPAKPISSITLTSLATEAAPVLLGLTGVS